MGHANLTSTDYSGQWPKPLQAAAKQASLAGVTADRPEVIDMSATGAAARLEGLAKTRPVTQVVDNYDEQLAELFVSRNAQLYRANPEIKANSIRQFLTEHYGGTPAWQKGSWVYYPWSGALVHVLDAELFWELRTIRNKNLITAQEQEAYAGFRAACLGMSVGSSGAVALVLQGGSRQIKIADGAVISGSNLNRIRTGVTSVGLEKSLVVSRQLYEMNPYIEVVRAPGAVRPDNLQAFLDQDWTPDVIIDEIDDLEMKIRLRVEARRRRLPVLMATDLGDDVMLDVERFDQDPSLPLFHGLAGTIEDVLDRKEMSQREWLKYATMIIGTKNVPLRMQESLLEVGTKLPTQPQLGGTAAMAGSVLAYAARQLALGAPLKSGRVSVSLDAVLLEGHGSWGQRRAHKRHSRMLDRAMDSM